MKNPKIESRMYREKKEALGEKKTQNGFIVKKKTDTISYGVDTNNITRKQMLDMLPEIVDTEYDKFVSPNIYDDLSTLERKKTGKVEHSSSGHDDTLMAYLIFRWAVFYGKCFRDRFGISPIPSRMNVKVVSSTENVNKIAEIISAANNADIKTTMSLNNPAYRALYEQEQKIKEADGTKNQVDSFMRILNFNKD